MYNVPQYRWNTINGQFAGFWELIFTYKNISEDKIRQVIKETYQEGSFYKYETPFGDIFTSHCYLFDI